MPELAKKLGIQTHMNIYLEGAPSEVECALRNAVPDAVFTTSMENPPYHVILFWPTQLEGLEYRFADLQRRIHPEGAIWAVMPKKKFAQGRGVDFSWEQMQAAGLVTDLVDNKVASISGQDYGTRFVIRKERRKSL